MKLVPEFRDVLYAEEAAVITCSIIPDEWGLEIFLIVLVKIDEELSSRDNGPIVLPARIIFELVLGRIEHEVIVVEACGCKRFHVLDGVDAVGSSEVVHRGHFIIVVDCLVLQELFIEYELLPAQSGLILLHLR